MKLVSRALLVTVCPWSGSRKGLRLGKHLKPLWIWMSASSAMRVSELLLWQRASACWGEWSNVRPAASLDESQSTSTLISAQRHRGRLFHLPGVQPRVDSSSACQMPGRSQSWRRPWFHASPSHLTRS